MDNTPDNEFLTTSALRARGWTSALIARFLPEPDETKQNPRYRSAAPMKLYEKGRVERSEASDAFKEALEQAEARRQAARKAVETKRAKTRAHVDEIEIRVPKLSRSELICQACDSYNARALERGDILVASPRHSDPAFLARIAVNYLRHELTPYDEHLDGVRGRVGVGEAYTGIRSKVLDAIAATYPWLAEECDRQRSRDS